MIDSFAKVPSGIMNGHLAWLGEFAECRNVTSGNLTGKYALFVHSLNAADIFKPGEDIVNKSNFFH